MTRTVLMLAALLAAYPAQAKPIRDLSLTPEESLRQPNITNSQGDPWNQRTTLESNRPSPALANPGNAATAPADRFMDGYCDSGFQSAASARGNAVQNCLQQTRQQACDLFARLPADAQSVVDRTISCASAEADAGDDYDARREPTDCRDADRQRLKLVKKYWQDKDTAYALVFVPGMVISPFTACSRGSE